MINLKISFEFSFSEKNQPGITIIRDYGKAKAAGWDTRPEGLSILGSGKFCDLVTFSRSLSLSEPHSLPCKTEGEK